jgi:hypothetical protein
VKTGGLLAAAVLGGLLAAVPSFAAAAPFTLLYETDADADAGSELFVRSFASLQDLIDGNKGAGSFSQVGILATSSVAGMAFDPGGALHLLYEQDTDADAGAEFFVRSFASLDDLIDGDKGAGSFSQLDILATSSVAGMTTPLDVSTVPEPAALALFGLGLACLAAAKGRRKMR